MAKAHRKTDEGRYKENRGTGELKDYIPWHNIVEVGSKGSSYRPLGIKTHRVQKFLSKIEYHYFLISERNESVIDIREQYPLDLTTTKQIARSIGVKHPSDKGVNITMTTDFLLTMQSGEDIYYIARTIKSEKDVDNERVIQKLSIEREYWNRQGIDWKLITDMDLPKTFIKNIEILRPNFDKYEDMMIDKKVEFFFMTRWNQFSKGTTINVMSLCNEIDTFFKQETGTTLKMFKAFAYEGKIKIDLERKILNPKMVIKED